jgi:hypothetical protein
VPERRAFRRLCCLVLVAGCGGGSGATEAGVFPCPSHQSLFRLTGEDPSGITFRLDRCMDRVRGGTPEARPLFLSIADGVESYVADRPEQMIYVVTHHNWDDELTATVGRAVLRWEREYHPPEGPESPYLTQTVGVRSEDGEELVAETVFREFDHIERTTIFPPD